MQVQQLDGTSRSTSSTEESAIDRTPFIEELMHQCECTHFDDLRLLTKTVSEAQAKCNNLSDLLGLKSSEITRLQTELARKDDEIFASTINIHVSAFKITRQCT